MKDMDINNITKVTESDKVVEITEQEQVNKMDGETRAKSPELKKKYDAISKDGDTLEISEKQIAKNQAGKVIISEDGIKTQAGKYTALALAKMSKVKLRQLLKDGQITKLQYSKAAKGAY